MNKNREIGTKTNTGYFFGFTQVKIGISSHLLTNTSITAIAGVAKIVCKHLKGKGAT